MRKRAFFILSLCLSLTWFGGQLLLAQTPLLQVIPGQLQFSGPIDGDEMTTSLHLQATVPLTNVQLFVTNLQDITNDGKFRDPIPGNKLTILPAARLEGIPVGQTTILSVQVKPPSQAGTYSGTLVIQWQEPSPGEVQLPITVQARTKPNLAIQSPAQVKINTEQNQSVVRQIVLQETVGGSSLTGLQALPSDLIAEQGQTIPAANLTLTPPTDIPGGTVAPVSLTLDTTGTSAGEYSGSILFSAPNGQTLSIPLNVNVKHAIWLPLLILVLSVGIGTTLMTYQETGRPRDKIVVRIADLRQAIAADDLLSADDSAALGFQQALTQHLISSETGLRTTNLDSAQQSILAAETLFNNWQGWRPAWVQILTYLHDTFPAKLNEAEHPDALIVETLRQQSIILLETAPTHITPAQLRQQILPLDSLLRQYFGLEALLAQIDTFPQPVITQFFNQKAALIVDLCQLSANDDKGRQAFREKVEALIREMEGASVTSESAVSRGVTMAGQTVVGSPDPSQFYINPISGQKAANRQHIFTMLAYIIGGIILIWAGIVALYADKATFGAHSADYLTLITWGFGGQTAFATLANRLIGWGMNKTEKSGE